MGTYSEKSDRTENPRDQVGGMTVSPENFELRDVRTARTLSMQISKSEGQLQLHASSLPSFQASITEKQTYFAERGSSYMLPCHRPSLPLSNTEQPSPAASVGDKPNLEFK